MRRAQFVVLSCTVLILTVAQSTAAGAAPTAGRPRVLGVGQIAQAGVAPPTGAHDQSDVVVQSQVATSPSAPGLAVAVTEADLQVTPAGTFGVALTEAYTGDGGASWRSQTVPGVTTAAGGTWSGVSWPTVAVARRGVVYVAVALRQAQACHTGLGVIRSDDGGATFGPLVAVRTESTCGAQEGRSSIVVDDGAHSPHRGRVYLAWTSYRFDADGDDIAQVQTLSWSDNRGATWSRDVAVTAPTGSTFGTTVVVAPNGAVSDLYAVNSPDFSALPLAASTSLDGGRSFGPSHRIAAVQSPTVGAADERCCTPTGGIDPVTGEMYEAVGDSRFQGGRFDDALVYRSADGAHWSGPVVADPTSPSPGLEHLTPAVAAYGGTVSVRWTLSPDPNGRWLREQVATSRDGGATFGPPATLGPDGDLTYAARASGFGFWLGDVAGLAAGPGRAYVVWPLAAPPARGHGQHQTLWGATVSTAAAATAAAATATAAATFAPRPAG